MVMFPHGVTVTVVRPGGVDRHGDKLPGSEHTVDGCGIAPASSSEDENRRDQVITIVTLYAPPDADVRATDQVRLPGGQLYTVQGDPADWRDPFTGWHPGMVVQLQRVRG